MTLPPCLIPGFTLHDVETGDLRIRAAVGGSGPPLLLLHGHPQTHATWHKIAPRLARRFTVVAADLRGYGHSSKPPGGEGHVNYAKRAMAKDQVEVMARLGFDRFAVVGHDRGGRVAHRMALDHPDRVERLAVLDIAPTATMYARTDKEFATRYFWWFFLIQPFDLPERLIGADPDYFLRRHIDGQVKTPGAVDEAIFQDYLRCYRDPATRHAVCEDYRAAATIDLEHDAADADRRVTAPLLALWGAKGVVGQLYDVLETWRDKARDVQGRAIDCGHALQEEAPDETLAELLAFLRVNPLLLLLDATSFTLAIVLVAMGLVIIFGLMRVINMAHGELFLLGAYTLLVVERLGGSFWVGLVAAPLVVGLVGLAVEELVVRRIYHRFLDTILATWGLSLLIKQAVVLGFGPQSQTVTPPFSAQIPLFGTPYPAYRLFIMGMAIAVVLLTFRLFLHTRFGLMARAVIANRPMAACLGIDTRRLDRLTFAYGSALAGFAGAVMAPIMSVDPQMGLGFLVPAFLAILTGGAQSLAGALFGSALVGGTDVVTASLLSPVAAQITVLAMAVVVIRLFPQGLYEQLRRR